MSIVRERRQIEAEVVLVYCDAPGCTASQVVQYSDPDRAPMGWYLVRHWGDYHVTASTHDPVGPWHFHTLKCLSVWAIETHRSLLLAGEPQA